MKHAAATRKAPLVVLLSLVLAACGGGGTGSPSAGTGATAAPGDSARTGTGATGSAGASGQAASPIGASPSGASPVASGAAATSPAATAAGTPSAGTPPASTVPASAGPGQFINPVLKGDFPDPHVIEVDGTYYAYATGIAMSRSKDLVKWDLPRGLPFARTWAISNYWAPEVAKTSAGYVMYYTGRSPVLKQPEGKGAQCIGRAVSDKPEGPFADEMDEPLVCQPELGGSIDATYFEDKDGKLYLIWKNDGNCCGIPTKFYMQQLSADGLKLTGEVTDLGVVDDAPWERLVNSRIEAPTLFLRDGTYYLFFSGSAHDKATYAVGYATSKNVRGPYKDAPENPILATGPDSIAAGPGHQTIITDDDGDLWMVYHAWDIKSIGFGGRSMWIDELVFEGGRAKVLGPDDDPQPVP